MGLWNDVRFAARLLIKDKWFTLVAALALALGIGVNAAVFTFVNAVLIRGLPIDEPDRVMALNSHDPVRSRDMGVSYLDFKDWREATRAFSELALYNSHTMNVSDEGKAPERFSGAVVSANAFRILGEAPVLGRDFLPDEDRPGAAATVVLGHGIWQNRYGGDPGVIGRTIRVNDVPSIVVGVMPEGFKFPQNADLWQTVIGFSNLDEQKRDARVLEAFGRLADGVSLEEARAEMAGIGQRLAADFPDTNKSVLPRVQTFNERMNGGPLRTVFLSLMGAVAFVLLIACANVANLLLARAAHRSREVSVRVSLGASRGRIVRQLLIESVLLAVIAGVLGLALAAAGIRVFDAATQEVGRPYWIQFTVDGRVFAFFAAICLGTGILFGLAPALHVAKTDVNEILKEGGRSGSAGLRARRWTGALIVGEIALTLVLLAGAGFMMRNFLTMYSLNLGIDTSRLLAMSLALPERKYPTAEQRLAFYERLEERLQANPRFQRVAATSNLPLQGGGSRRLAVDGRAMTDGEQPAMVTMLVVSPRYFDTVGLPLLRGRTFNEGDGGAGQEHAIVNSRFVQMHFANEDPIGRRITLAIEQAGVAPPAGVPTSLTVTIVGVVPNVRQREFARTDPDPVAYVPFRADPRGFISLLARAEGDPAQLTPLLREEIRAIDPDLPLFNIRPVDEVLAMARWPFRIFGTMFAIFAGIALLLSAIGLYAVTAYSVTQRTQEIGVRMALGAASQQVMWLFLRRALVQLGIGLTVGIAGALAVGQLFGQTGLLVQTSPRDPLTIAAIALVLVVVALAACLLPARRATVLDPLVALRRE